MSDLADMLEAMHTAPRFRSFSGIGLTMSDQAKTMAWLQIHRRRDQHDGMFATGSGVSQVSAVSGSMSVSIGGGDEGSEPTEAPAEVWIDLRSSPTMWRTDQGEMVTIATRDELLTWSSGSGMRRPRVAGSTSLPQHWDRVFSPAALSGTLLLGRPETVEVAGRPCWRSRGTRRSPDQQQRFAMMMSSTMPGDELEISVDKATGIVLAWTGWHDGEMLASLEFTSVEIDAPIASELFHFEPPDGSVLPSQDELIREQLRTLGVDPDGLDSGEVRDELQKMIRGFGSSSSQDPETRARSFTPTGEPPDDEDDARIDIGLAFENLDATDDDGADLINVERGEGLGPLMTKTAARYGDDGAKFTVQHIKFLNAVEAMVWFTADIKVMQVPFEGRARYTDAGWKVSRSTLGELLARAGVVVPPPD